MLRRLTRCLLDRGSQSRFIAASLIDDLQIINGRELTDCAFDSQYTQSCRRRPVRLNMKGSGRIPWFQSLLTTALKRFQLSQLSHMTLRPWRMPVDFNWLTLRTIPRKIFPYRFSSVAISIGSFYTAFNHPPIFYISYSSRLVTFNMTNLEF